MDTIGAVSAKRRGRGRPPGSKNKTSIKTNGQNPSQQDSVGVEETAQGDQPYLCRWRGCSAQLHNWPKLCRHVEKVHVKKDDTKFECWWRRCRFLQITEGKRINSIPFMNRDKLLKHITEEHLTPISWEFGDGPSDIIVDPHTLERQRRIFTSDADGHQVTPIASSSATKAAPLDPMHLPVDDKKQQKLYLRTHATEKSRGSIAAAEELFRSMVWKKEQTGPGIDRGGATLITPELRATLMDNEGIMRIVDDDEDSDDGF